MCDICKSHKKDTFQLNGTRYKKLHQNTLYNIYKNMCANISLCRYHDIELFKFGESRFFMHYENLNNELADKSHRFKYKS